MAVIPRMHNPFSDTCSIGFAAAFFNMSDKRFTREFIQNGKLRMDRLHQLQWSKVLKVYFQLPEQRKKEAIASWRLKKAFDHFHQP